MPPLAPAGFAAAAAFLSTPVIGGITIGGILTTAALSGASFLLSAAFAPKISQAQQELDEGKKIVVQQAVPDQLLIYGRALVGGPVFFHECKPPYLYLGIVLCSHEIDGVEVVRIGNDIINLDANGNATDIKYNDGTNVYLKVSIQKGTTTQGVDPILAADFPDLESTFKQEGYATAVLKMLHSKPGLSVDAAAEDHERVWGNGTPKPSFLVRGMKVYDPRKAHHDIDDSSTWEWSDTASLCLAHYMTYIKGFNRSWSKINLDDLIDSANSDDEQVQLLSGSFESRYSVNGVVDTSTEPIQPVLDMLTANMGHIVWRDGKYSILSGVPRPAVWTFNDNSARGSMNVRYQRPTAELVNIVRTQFTSPEREYQSAEGPVLRNNDYITADNEEHEISIILPFTATHTRAQRLAKIVMERARLGKLITRRESIEALIVSAVDHVNIESDFRSVVGMLGEINAAKLAEDTLEVDIEMEEYSDSIYDWDAAVDEQSFEMPVTELVGVN